MSEERFLFAREGERFVPSALCRGPWYPGTQHGSPMLGLLVRGPEAAPDSWKDFRKGGTR